MNDLVVIQRNDVFTDSLIIARETGNRHINIKRLCQQYENQFRQLGTLCVLNAESSGGRPEQIYQLNEPQASLETENITAIEDREKYITLKRTLGLREKRYYQYEYTHIDGDVFTYEKQTLEKCRKARDKWLEKKAEDVI